MKIQQLEYFVKTAAMSSITHAAAALYISPQALSKRIMSLEDELGVRLFDRAHGKVELTRMGQSVYAEAEKLLDTFKKTEERIHGIINRGRGKLTLVCAESCLYALNPDPIALFSQKYGAEVEVLEMRDVLAQDYIIAHDLDFGLTTAPLDARKYYNHKIYTGRLCAVVRKDHPLAKMEFVPLSRLKNFKVQAKNRLYNSNQRFMDCLEENRIKISPMSSNSDYVGFKNTVSAGQTVGVGLNFLDLTENLIALPFDREIQWNLYLVEKKNVELPYLCGKLIEIIKECGQK